MTQTLFTGATGGFLLLLAVLLGVLVAYQRFQLELDRWLARKLPFRITARQAVLVTVAVLALLVFIGIAEEVMERETDYFDRGVEFALKGIEIPVIVKAMKGFTFIGSFPAAVTVILVMIAWALFRRDRRAALVLAVASTSEALLNLGLKTFFERFRPSIIQRLSDLHSYSFPSGHAMGAMVIYGTITLVLIRWYPRQQQRVVLFSALLILAIGFSRIYLGVHWPTDVLAGYALGTVLVIAASMLLPVQATTLPPQHRSIR